MVVFSNHSRLNEIGLSLFLLHFPKMTNDNLRFFLTKLSKKYVGKMKL